MLVTEEIPAFGVLIVLFAFSFILNGTFIIVICKNWTLVKRRRVTYHVTSIAISDSLVGASGFCIQRNWLDGRSNVFTGRVSDGN